ncbi:MAG: peroxiredoxin [Candidatus Bathyarchaeota archaeon]|nr:peroxiredoxin [Candidatus Bathyarchaeota archaeon]
MTKLKIGDLAPKFTLTDDRGLPISLNNYLGKKIVVLYFYPRDFTSGCTKEACNFRDDYQVYEEKGAVVIGISLDSQETHKKFSKKHNLPFSLLSDNQKDIAKQYGVLGFGDRVAKRVTFIIDKQGRIAWIFPKVDVKKHSKEVLEIIDKIKD